MQGCGRPKKQGKPYSTTASECRAVDGPKKQGKPHSATAPPPKKQGKPRIPEDNPTDLFNMCHCLIYVPTGTRDRRRKFPSQGWRSQLATTPGPPIQALTSTTALGQSLIVTHPSSDLARRCSRATSYLCVHCPAKHQA